MKYFVALGVLAGITLGGASVASAVDCPDSSPSAVSCVQVEAVTLEPAVVPVAVATPSAAPAAPVQVAGKQQLPVTGSDALTLALVGGTFVAVGGVFVLRSRSGAVEA